MRLGGIKGCAGEGRRENRGISWDGGGDVGCLKWAAEGRASWRGWGSGRGVGIFD